MSKARPVLLNPVSGISCNICLTDLLLNPDLRPCALPCGHLFHDECLKTWVALPRNLGSKAPCPSCRTQFVKNGSLVVWPLRLFFSRLDEVSAGIQGDQDIKDKEEIINNLNRRLIQAQENLKKEELKGKSVTAKWETSAAELEKIRKENGKLREELSTQTKKRKFFEAFLVKDLDSNTLDLRSVQPMEVVQIDLTGDDDDEY